MRNLIEQLPWIVVIAACATIGLAPFSPPHIWEKLQMLFSGRLVRVIDWLDLLLHGVPWLLLVAKVAVTVWRRPS